MCSGKPMIFLLPDQTYDKNAESENPKRHKIFSQGWPAIYQGLLIIIVQCVFFHNLSPTSSSPVTKPTMIHQRSRYNCIMGDPWFSWYSMIMSIHQYPSIKLYRHPIYPICTIMHPMTKQSTSISRAFGAKFAQNVGQQQHLLEVGPLVTRWHGWWRSNNH